MAFIFPVAAAALHVGTGVAPAQVTARKSTAEIGGRQHNHMNKHRRAGVLTRELQPYPVTA